jgi:hypothetical protein
MSVEHRKQPIPRLLAGLALAMAVSLPAPGSAADGVPARVRLAKATRAQVAQLDPRLADVKKQISALAWQKWELLADQEMTLTREGHTVMEVPGVKPVVISLVEQRGDTVTIEVAIAQRNTQTRITIEKKQRIVHQVAKEKDGVAHFLIITPWP